MQLEIVEGIKEVLCVREVGMKMVGFLSKEGKYHAI